MASPLGVARNAKLFSRSNGAKTSAILLINSSRIPVAFIKGSSFCQCSFNVHHLRNLRFFTNLEKFQDIDVILAKGLRDSASGGKSTSELK